MTKRTWWILPYTGGLLSVVVVAVGAVLLHQHLTKPRPVRTTHAAAPAAPMPAEMFPDGLFGKLTQDMQTGNEAGFLSLAAPSAEPAMRSWWGNLQAIGFTTGAVIPTASEDTVHLDSHGNGVTTVLAGAHSGLDALGPQNKPEIPLERYQVGLHFASPTAVGQITSWQPLGDDPLAQGVPLYVRKADNVIVAGLPGDSGLVDETLPIAETAASYDIALMNHVNPHDLAQQGFVVFVADQSAGTWFGPGPGGWPGGILGGRTIPLPGPGVSGDSSVSSGSSSLVAGIADGTTGGARVVITPFEHDGGTAHGETVTLVRDFMLDILAAHDQAIINGLGGPAPVPAWAEEGLAVAVQGLFEQNSDPTPAAYNFGVLTSGLRSLPKSFRTGRLPTGQQLFSGSLNDQENWNDVAASVYEYIEVTHGMNQMLGAAMLLWTNEPSPFGNVLKSSTKNTFTFYGSGTIKAAWRTSLARL